LRSPASDLEYAIGLVSEVCARSGEPDLIADIRRSFRKQGLSGAIREHDSDAIFDWMVEAISYQGISDHVAASYIEQHGSVSAYELRQGLSRQGLCPKLKAYWRFEGCGYRKAAGSCNAPQRYLRCPLPRHDLRNGSLNQAAYSLYLFMRDVADGDFVGWIDQRLDAADQPSSPLRAQLLRDAVVGPLLNIHGVSHKVVHMALASLLLADGRRKRWQLAGSAMVAIDTLVHNWLWRTGIMQRLGTPHSYGSVCYGAGGCEEIINLISRHIDARGFNVGFPAVFPRFVQKAIWVFCAASGSNQCNGNTIDDSERCKLSDCPLFEACDRIRLGSS
jgi:hypothetical protein